jgi:PAS domain S-box-containing protein
MDESVKFLLVDDVEANLHALEALLRQDGLEMLSARSGGEALELLLVHDFALALIDVQMPGMSGFELAELMRGTARTRAVPIILVTAGGDEGRRFKGYEAGAVDFLMKPIDTHMLRRKAGVFFELARQRRELMRQRDEIEASEHRFRNSLLLAPTPVALFDDRGAVITVNAEWMAGTGCQAEEIRSMDEWAARACGARAAEVLDQIGMVVRAEADRVRIELDITCRRGAIRSWDMLVSPVGPGAGERRLFVCIAHDVTERTQAERTRQLLVSELNHRVKNNLATVLAIAKLTLRQTNDPERFTKSFMGRILALSEAHSLLSKETWQGAGLGDLLRKQLALGSVDETRLVCAGPQARLASQIALHVALMLHELVTNAAKYGSLSIPSGRVFVTWTVDAGWLRLSWVERDGPHVDPPTRRGFGSALIERSAKACGGSAALNFLPGGMVCDIIVPLAGGT